MKNLCVLDKTAASHRTQLQPNNTKQWQRHTPSLIIKPNQGYGRFDWQVSVLVKNYDEILYIYIEKVVGKISNALWNSGLCVFLKEKCSLFNLYIYIIDPCINVLSLCQLDWNQYYCTVVT